MCWRGNLTPPPLQSVSYCSLLLRCKMLKKIVWNALAVERSWDDVFFPKMNLNLFLETRKNSKLFLLLHDKKQRLLLSTI